MRGHVGECFVLTRKKPLVFSFCLFYDLFTFDVFICCLVRICVHLLSFFIVTDRLNSEKVDNFAVVCSLYLLLRWSVPIRTVAQTHARKTYSKIHSKYISFVSFTIIAPFNLFISLWPVAMVVVGAVVSLFFLFFKMRHSFSSLSSRPLWCSLSLLFAHPIGEMHICLFSWSHRTSTLSLSMKVSGCENRQVKWNHLIYEELISMSTPHGLWHRQTHTYCQHNVHTMWRQKEKETRSTVVKSIHFISFHFCSKYSIAISLLFISL